MKMNIFGEERDINRMLFLGCSFVAGDELRDHEILGISMEECDEIKRNTPQNIFYNDIVYKKLPYEKYSDYSFKATWAYKLSQKFDLTYVNRSRGGGGSQHCLFSANILEHVDNMQQGDVLFVGLTFVERLFHIDENFYDHVVVMGFDPPKRLVSYEHMHNFFTLPHMLWAYYSSFNSIMDICHRLNVPVVFVRMINHLVLPTLEDEVRKTAEFTMDQPTVENYFKQIDKMKKKLDERTLDILSLSDCSTSIDHHHGYGHPTCYAHDILATNVYDRLKI